MELMGRAEELEISCEACVGFEMVENGDVLWIKAMPKNR